MSRFLISALLGYTDKHKTDMYRRLPTIIEINGEAVAARGLVAAARSARRSAAASRRASSASLWAMGPLRQRRSGGCAGDRGCQPTQTAAVSLTSACHAAGASACCAASGRPDADPVHAVHARAACFANFDNDVVRLLQGGATRHGVNR